MGVLAQYTHAAYRLSISLRITASEIAVGVILVVRCPGGTASNVADLFGERKYGIICSRHHHIDTSCSFLTPVFILLFARSWLPVSPEALFLSIVQVVLIPIILGVIVKLFFKNK
ncbi:hypothetical protein ACEQPO_16330 [Bacillus sp. SL00103]